MTEEIPTKQTCRGCINLKLYAGSGTGECDIHQRREWIGELTEACSLYWLNTHICLTCTHWERIKKRMSGQCRLKNQERACDNCYCEHWKERENLKEYLNKIIEGKE